MSKRNLITYAKALIKDIVQKTSTLAANELLILRGNELVIIQRIEAYITPEGEVIEIDDNCIQFGSLPLKPTQVKNIIMNEEQSEYL